MSCIKGHEKGKCTGHVTTGCVKVRRLAILYQIVWDSLPQYTRALTTMDFGELVHPYGDIGRSPMFNEKACVYIIVTGDMKFTYTGWTLNIENRLAQHNGIRSGGAKYTKGKKWEIMMLVTLGDNAGDHDAQDCIQKGKGRIEQRLEGAIKKSVAPKTNCAMIRKSYNVSDALKGSDFASVHWNVFWNMKVIPKECLALNWVSDKVSHYCTTHSSAQ